MVDSKITINEILQYLRDEGFRCDFVGDSNAMIGSASAVSAYKEGSITWIRDKSVQIRSDLFYQLLVAPIDVNVENANVLSCDEPRNVYFHILTKYFSVERNTVISERAIIPTSVIIGRNTYIGDFCVIGENVSIGTCCYIENTVTIGDDVTIGDGCTIKSGARIGGDGFGYYQTASDKLERIPHLGSVKIGDRVDIGSNTCIDRGTLGDTTISDDVKINNLCHIAHNCCIGSQSTIGAGSTICGSCTLGSKVHVSSATIRDHCTIGDRSIIGAGAVVIRNIPSDTIVVGNPAKPLPDGVK